MAEDRSFFDDQRQPVEDREQRKFQADISGDVAVNVLSRNIEAQLDAILDALDVTAGESYFAKTQTLTTPGVMQTLISEAVPVGKLRGLTKVNVRCRQEGEGYVYADGELIASFSTGGSSPNAKFEWSPKFLVSAGLLVEVLFKMRTGGPIVDVEGFLQALDKNI
jgi:hypothetical protein